MHIDVPDLDYAGAVLQLDDRPTLGERTITAEALADRVLIGGPLTTPISAKAAGGDEPLLRTLADQSAGFQFHLVTLGCTFAPQDGERFDRVWVQVRLSHGAAGWSMLPERAAQPIKLTPQVELGLNLKFVTVTFSSGAERDSDEPYIEALNVLLDTPTWRFTRVHGRELDSEQRLLLIVRAPAAAPTSGEVRLRAVLRRKSLGPFSYRLSAPESPYARTDDPVAGRFVLGA